MSTRHNHADTVAEVRLSVLAEAAVNLIAKLFELKELRERVRKAELSTLRSRRTSHRKRKRTQKRWPANLNRPPKP
jgi:hypothetical protein